MACERTYQRLVGGVYGAEELPAASVVTSAIVFQESAACGTVVVWMWTVRPLIGPPPVAAARCTLSVTPSPQRMVFADAEISIVGVMPLSGGPTLMGGEDAAAMPGELATRTRPLPAAESPAAVASNV